MAMVYFLVVLEIFAVGGFLQFFFGLAASDVPEDTFSKAFESTSFPFLLCLTLAGILIFIMARSPIQRRGWLASFRNFTFALAVPGFLSIWQLVLGVKVDDTLSAYEPNVNSLAANLVYFPFFIYIIGGIIMAVFLLTRRKDILLWFPAKRKKGDRFPTQ